MYAILKSPVSYLLVGLTIVSLTSCSKANKGSGNNPPAQAETGPTVYITNEDSVYSFDAYSGHVKWVTDVSYRFSPFNSWQGSLPAVNGNTIFINISSTLFALDRISGATIWRFVDENDSYFGGPIINNDTVFVGSSAQFYALSAATGKIIWQINMPGSFNLLPVLFNNRLYLNTLKGLLVLDAHNGAQILFTPFNSGGTPSKNVFGAPLIYDNIVFVQNDLSMLAINLITGAKIWTFAKPDSILSFSGEGPMIFGDRICTFSSATPLILDTEVAALYYHLYELDARSGKLDTDITFPEGIPFNYFTISGGTFYMSFGPPGVNDGFAAYNLQTNQINWFSTALDGYNYDYSFVAPTTFDGIVYATGADYVSLTPPNFSTFLFALDSTSGALIWFYNMRNISSSPVIVDSAGKAHYTSAFRLNYN